nr:MAG TPA: hypothetical protein [Caudoviricetes sp.]
MNLNTSETIRVKLMNRTMTSQRVMSETLTSLFSLLILALLNGTSCN